MSAVCWSHLLPDPLRMGRLSTDDLDAIERTAEREALTMAHGISAIQRYRPQYRLAYQFAGHAVRQARGRGERR